MTQKIPQNISFLGVMLNLVGFFVRHCTSCSNHFPVWLDENQDMYRDRRQDVALEILYETSLLEMERN